MYTWRDCLAMAGKAERNAAILASLGKTDKAQEFRHMATQWRDDAAYLLRNNGKVL